ncbi:unnamed protein product [Tilletia laevis]|uniref:Uncharacterized protein n=1 Tax=Tilletia laevis TaxID=157183 RepID=A0A9N8QEL8_9BASI|nr:unnamed protein product [Tilletia caries]CAD6934253.1 unnamed protein product [Tilletia laevis]CAD6942238.1 unnamed protein product [Tilletia caries]
MSESDLFQPLARHDYERMVLLTCLSSAESGVWLWELAYGIRFDWMLLTGQHSVRPSMVFYLLLRISYTCQVFASFAFLANSKSLDCTLVLSILSVSIYVSGFPASSIFASRALSAWGKSRLIAAILSVLVLGQFGVLISNITSLRGNMVYIPYVGWRCIGEGAWWSEIFRQASYNAAYDIFLAMMTLFRLRKNAKDVQLLNIVVRDVKILGGLAIFPTGVMLIVYAIMQSDVVGSVSLPTAVLIRAIIASRSYQQVFRMGQTADFKERRILSKIANGEILDADALRGSFLPMRPLKTETVPAEQASEARTRKSGRDSTIPLTQDVEAQQPAVQVNFNDESAPEFPSQSPTTGWNAAISMGNPATKLPGIPSSAWITHCSPNITFQDRTSKHFEPPFDEDDTRADGVAEPQSDHSDSIASTRQGKATASTGPTHMSSQGSLRTAKEGETPSRSRILASIDSAIVSHPSTPIRLVSGDPSAQQRPQVYIPSSGPSISFTEATQRLKKK